MPAGFDPMLQTLFDEEFAENMAIPLRPRRGQPLTLTEAICRSVHTILGISMTAKCEPIATVFDVLETRFYALKAQDAALSGNPSCGFGRNVCRAIPSAEFPWTTATDLLPAWLEIAGTMTGPVIEQQDEESPEEVLVEIS